MLWTYLELGGREILLGDDCILRHAMHLHFQAEGGIP